MNETGMPKWLVILIAITMIMFYWIPLLLPITVLVIIVWLEAKRRTRKVNTTYNPTS
jgi:hypothetical protein